MVHPLGIATGPLSPLGLVFEQLFLSGYIAHLFYPFQFHKNLFMTENLLPYRLVDHIRILGVCQIDALGMAFSNHDAGAILSHYYPRSKLRTIYSS